MLHLVYWMVRPQTDWDHGKDQDLWLRFRTCGIGKLSCQGHDKACPGSGEIVTNLQGFHYENVGGFLYMDKIPWSKFHDCWSLLSKHQLHFKNTSINYHRLTATMECCFSCFQSRLRYVFFMYAIQSLLPPKWTKANWQHHGSSLPSRKPFSSQFDSAHLIIKINHSTLNYQSDTTIVELSNLVYSSHPIFGFARTTQLQTSL